MSAVASGALRSIESDTAAATARLSVLLRRAWIRPLVETLVARPLDLALVALGTGRDDPLTPYSSTLQETNRNGMLWTPRRWMADPPKLKLLDLGVGYQKGRSVLGGLSLDVVPGEVLAVVGPNGSGKTTLFRTLLGVLAPVGGEASISGVAPGDYRRRHGVGYLAEDTALPPGWVCDGLLTMAASASGAGADVGRACRLAGVDYDTRVLVDKLSKGMRRRLALAVALMRPNGLLFLDEPESGLDPGQRIRLRRQVEEIRSEMTILVASHDLGELAMMSDRVLLIGQGRGRIIEQPEGRFTREFLEAEFLGLEEAGS